MIHILHGDDTQASYLRLQNIISSQPASQKITVTKDNNHLLTQALFSQDLFNSKKIVILEDLLSSKNVTAKDLKKVSESLAVVIWESQQLSAPVLKSFQNIANIENFKPPGALFYFLDALTPNSKRALYYLSKLETDTKSLSWHLENRLLLLLLAKLNMTDIQASVVSGRNLAPWQWQKIVNQSKLFDLTKLKGMFTSTLRIETLIKTGATSIAEKTLISLMLSKHLT